MIRVPKFGPVCGAPVDVVLDRPRCTDPHCPGRVLAEIQQFLKGMSAEACSRIIYDGGLAHLIEEQYIPGLPELFEFAQDMDDQYVKDSERFNRVITKMGLDPRGVRALSSGVLTVVASRPWSSWLQGLLGLEASMAGQVETLVGKDLEDLADRLSSERAMGIEGLDCAFLWRWGAENRDLCLRLHELGCRPLVKEAPKSKPAKGVPEPTGSGPCAGITICLTGEHLGIERDQLQKHLASLGAVVKNGVSKKLTHLCAGSGAGTSKLQKARELGILVVNTDWLKRTLEEGGIDVGPGNGGFELSLGREEDVEI